MKIEVNKKYTFENNQYLWRYIDLHRLIYFLTTGNIFFSPLINFFDPLEGIEEKHLQDKGFEDAVRGNTKKEETSPSIKEQFISTLQKVQRTNFASSWYFGERESQAMWDMYSNKDSVALRFKPHELIEALLYSCREVNNSDFEVLVHGKVEYFKITPPEEIEAINPQHPYKGFLKDISYQHEAEFRFVAIQRDNEKEYTHFEVPLNDLPSLDFSIVTHPSMEPWKYDNILNILKGHHLEKKLCKSTIPTRALIFDNP